MRSRWALATAALRTAEQILRKIFFFFVGPEQLGVLIRSKSNSIEHLQCPSCY